MVIFSSFTDKNLICLNLIVQFIKTTIWKNSVESCRFETILQLLDYIFKTCNPFQLSLLDINLPINLYTCIYI